MPDPAPQTPQGAVDRFIDVAKQQGIAAAIALGLLLALVYQIRETTKLARSIEALGDLVISSCMPDKDAVQRFIAERANNGGKP